MAELAYPGQRGDIAELVIQFGASGWVSYGADPETPRYWQPLAGGKLYSPEEIAAAEAAARSNGGDGFALGDFAALDWRRYATPADLSDSSRGFYWHPGMAGGPVRCVEITDSAVIRKGPHKQTWLDRVTYAAAVGMIAAGTGAILWQVAGGAALGAGGGGASAGAPAGATGIAPATAEVGAGGLTMGEISAGAKATAETVASGAKIATDAAKVVGAVSAISNAGINWSNVAQAAKNADKIAASTEKAKNSLDAVFSDPKTLLYIGAAVLAAVAL